MNRYTQLAWSSYARHAFYTDMYKTVPSDLAHISLYSVEVMEAFLKGKEYSIFMLEDRVSDFLSVVQNATCLYFFSENHRLTFHSNIRLPISEMSFISRVLPALPAIVGNASVQRLNIGLVVPDDGELSYIINMMRAFRNPLQSVYFTVYTYTRAEQEALCDLLETYSADTDKWNVVCLLDSINIQGDVKNYPSLVYTFDRYPSCPFVYSLTQRSSIPVASISPHYLSIFKTPFDSANVLDSFIEDTKYRIKNNPIW